MSLVTKNQEIFVDEYLIDFNATRAYKVAYPNIKKDETAAAAGARMLRNVNVANYIEKRMDDRKKRIEITQDKVLEELALVAFSNAADYAQIIQKQAVDISSGKCVPMIDKDGKPVMMKQVDVTLTEKLTEEQKRALASIKEGRNGIEIKTHDKVHALELLGRHLGMFKDKVEVSGLVEEQSKLSELLEQRRMRRGAK